MKELSLKDIRTILDEMEVLGTQAISFSGGEPMLRQDIGEIFEYTKKLGISTEMNSTGVHIPENIAKLNNLDFLKISLDGPEEINDLLRGKGSYRVAIEAAESAKRNKISFIFTTTLTKYNINSIDFLIGLAEKYNTLVAFQPFKDLYRGEKDSPHLYPGAEEFKKIVTKLIAIKKSGNSHLRNSLLGLYHIYNWPKYNKLKCWAGKIFCIIETDGTLLPCDRISYNTKLPNCLEKGFTEALSSLPEVQCGGCGFCGTMELNFTMSLRLGVIKSIIEVLK
jgi:MoaA/NifB/PqqE/SkfB family radical SAM enzyme